MKVSIVENKCIRITSISCISIKINNKKPESRKIVDDRGIERLRNLEVE